MDNSKQAFSKGDVQMANRFMKNCSTSVIIREMQIKATMKYHLTRIRLAVIKKTKYKKWWWWCGGKRSLHTDGGNMN